MILISSRHDSSVDYSSSPYDSQKGPYADVLQDFMIRSYMSGGRKSKPSVNIGIMTMNAPLSMNSASTLSPNQHR